MQNQYYVCAVDGGPRATFSALFFHLSVILEQAARNRARVAPWLFCSRFSSARLGACVTQPPHVGVLQVQKIKSTEK